MYFRILGLLILVSTHLTFAQGRGPAVEDFVGIEVEETVGVPQGTESLFNFEKEIKKLESKKEQPRLEDAAPGTATAAMAITFILGLPLMIWFMMMNHMKNKAHQEGASNIEVLEKYRKEKLEAKKALEESKKAA